MRLPRMQISIRGLLFAIAIVALNLGVLRLLFRMVAQIHGGFPLSYHDYGFIAGLIPLFNGALIGASLYTARQIRSRGGSRTENRQVPPAAFTLFSVQFLALAAIAGMLVPDEIRELIRLLESQLRTVEDAWVALFTFYNDLAWFALECVILSVTISGPMLMLSWIAGVLAKRSAARMTRRRVRVMACLVSFAFASVAMAVALTPFDFADEQDVDLDFRVVDKESGKPIAGVFVRISSPFAESDAVVPKALTGADGHARLTDRFPAFGQRNSFQSTGLFLPWGRWLELSAVHYQTSRVAPLPDVLEPHVELGRHRTRTVALTRGQPRDFSFREIAGVYCIPDRKFGSSSFVIEPDGRFAWSIYGHSSPVFEEYGHLKRNDGEIELARVWHSRSEFDPALTSTVRVIGWRDRLYLTSRGDRGIADLCRVALAPNDAPDWTDTFGGYIRDGDPTKPLTGLPRLPVKAVVQFVYRGLNLRNEDGILRVALESLTEREFR